METQPPAVPPAVPSLEYRRGRGRVRRRFILTSFPLIWADYPPPGWLTNGATFGFSIFCIWNQRGLGADRASNVLAIGLWVLVALGWLVKIRFAMHRSVPAPKGFWRSTRWMTVPILLVLTSFSYMLDVPLRVQFLIDYSALRKIASLPNRQSTNVFAATHSFNIESVITKGPRVTLYAAGGVNPARAGFQWVKDGSSPYVGRIDHLIPMGGGWYAFYDDQRP
jgi:hypothetical protein